MCVKHCAYVNGDLFFLYGYTYLAAVEVVDTDIVGRMTAGLGRNRRSAEEVGRSSGFRRILCSL